MSLYVPSYRGLSLARKLDSFDFVHFDGPHVADPSHSHTLRRRLEPKRVNEVEGSVKEVQ